jgi:hypothetical protein
MKSNPLINETLLQMKFARIINILAGQLGVTPQKALKIFYSTNVYKYMSNLEFHLHNRSDLYCADEVMLELQNR